MGMYTYTKKLQKIYCTSYIHSRWVFRQSPFLFFTYKGIFRGR